MAKCLFRSRTGAWLALAAALPSACSSARLPAEVEPQPPTVSVAETTSATAIDPGTAPPPTAAVDTLDLEALRGVWRSASSPPAFLSFRISGSRYITDGFPTWQESGRIELLAVEGQRLRVRFVERIYDGKEDEDQERTIELAPDGRSFAMAGRTFQRLDHDAAVARDPEP